MFHQAPDTMTIAGNQIPKGAGYLSLQALEKRYAEFTAVDRIDLDVRRGEFVSLLGPSGCGKTTTLRMIAGLVPTTSGKIVVDGRDITAEPTWARDMGLVFQSYALFPHMTIAANIAFGLEMRKLRKAEIQSRVAQAIAMVRLEGREQRKPSALSGGQQQRVALARALVIQPSILLLDEPLSNLDAKLRDEMRNEIRDLQKRLAITTVFVTHDQEEALTMSDRIVVMNQGRIEQVGTPQDLYERPATPFVASFVGRSNRLSCSIRQSIAQVGALALPVDAPDCASAEIMIRPHRIALSIGPRTVSPGTCAVAGRIVRTVYAGEQTHYDVDASGVRFQIEQPTAGNAAILPEGADVTISWSVDDARVFGVKP
jgi:putative spermidine/putrescine transport system ATP-binding protein